MLGLLRSIGVILHQIPDSPSAKIRAERVQCRKADVIHLRALHPLDGRRRKPRLLRNLGKGQISVLSCFFVAPELVKVALKHFRLSIHQTAYLQSNMVIFYHKRLDKVRGLSHNIFMNLQFMNREHGVKLQVRIPVWRVRYENSSRVGADFSGAFSPRVSGGRVGSCRAHKQMILGANLLAGICAIVGLRSNPQRPTPVKSASFTGVSLGSF